MRRKRVRLAAGLQDQIFTFPVAGLKLPNSTGSFEIPEAQNAIILWIWVTVDLGQTA